MGPACQSTSRHTKPSQFKAAAQVKTLRLRVPSRRVGIIDLRELFRGTAVTESQPGGFLALAPVECRIWLLEL